MNFMEQYQDKLTSAKKIASLLQSGMIVESDLALSAPPAILTAMAKRIAENGLTGIEYYCSLDLMPLSFFLEPEKIGKIRVISWFSGAYSKKAINRGQIEVFPNDLWDSYRLVWSFMNPDMFVATVSPMDKHGYFPGAEIRVDDQPCDTDDFLFPLLRNFSDEGNVPIIVNVAEHDQPLAGDVPKR